MKRPSFQFYPADWRSNAKLRRCSEAARGAWMDILGVLHDSDEYGVVRWPLADLARAAGVSMRLAKELSDKLVLKGGDKELQPFIYVPVHAGKKGDPVTLIEGGDGPCWYSSRMVRDEWVKQRRGVSTQFTTDNQPPKTPPKTPIGERDGDGPTSSSPSPSAKKKKDSALARFPEFWAVCPKKTASGAAEKAWRKALLLADADTLIAAMRAYAESQIGKDRAYVKTPGPWLNEKRWLDDGIAPAAAPEAAELEAARALWGGDAARLVDAIGPGAFKAYFDGALFDPGPPARIRVKTPFMRDRIAAKFGSKIKVAYGEFELVAA